VTHGPRRARPPTARTGVAIIATAGLALLASACGGSPNSHVAQLGSSTTQSASSADPASASASAPASASASAPGSGALAFSQCVRAHGVPNFPDPNGSGDLPPNAKQIAHNSPQFPTAVKDCQHLLPHGGQPSQAEVARERAQALNFSRCVRAHGVPNFPDPDNTGRIPDPASLGINQGSPQFEAANQACQKYRPPYIPSNAAYNAYARTQTS
jgi:hypothetical protein